MKIKAFIIIFMTLVSFIEISAGQGKKVFYYKYRNGETFTVTKERTGDTLNIAYFYSDPEKLGNLNYEYKILFPSGKLLSAEIFKDDRIYQYIFKGDVILIGEKEGEKTYNQIPENCHVDLYEAMAKFVASGEETGTVLNIFKSTGSFRTQEFNMKRGEDTKIETPAGIFDAVNVSLSLPSICQLFIKTISGLQPGRTRFL